MKTGELLCLHSAYSVCILNFFQCRHELLYLESTLAIIDPLLLRLGSDFATCIIIVVRPFLWCESLYI